MLEIEFDIPNFEEEELNPNNSIEIGKKLAIQLRKNIGKVHVSFAKNDNKYLSSLNKTMRILSDAADINNAAPGTIDINSIYDSAKYVFMLNNGIYRFTAFIVEYKMNYPIFVTIDDDIAVEIGYENYKVKVSNNEEYINLLSHIVSSPKFKSVIKTMNSSINNTVEKNS